MRQQGILEGNAPAKGKGISQTEDAAAGCGGVVANGDVCQCRRAQRVVAEASPFSTRGIAAKGGISQGQLSAVGHPTTPVMRAVIADSTIANFHGAEVVDATPTTSTVPSKVVTDGAVDDGRGATAVDAAAGAIGNIVPDGAGRDSQHSLIEDAATGHKAVIIVDDYTLQGDHADIVDASSASTWPCDNVVSDKDTPEFEQAKAKAPIEYASAPRKTRPPVLD